MNKEFLDPNTRYSDQKVDLAKMPGMLQTINNTIGQIGENVGDIQDTLSTTGATAGQMLKVETPGEPPVWGSGGLVLNTTHMSKSLNASQVNQVVRGEVPYIYITAQINAKGDRAFFAGSRNTPEQIKTTKGTSGDETVDKHIVFHKFMQYNPSYPNLLTVGVQASMLYESEIDPNWTYKSNAPAEDFYIAWLS